MGKTLYWSNLQFRQLDADKANVADTAAANDDTTKIATTAFVKTAAANVVFTHPTGDGNLHVPATSTVNNGEVLKAGATAGTISWGTLVKGDVGLGNVDNTTDAAKPVSTATQTALNLKANLASPTFTGTVSGITATMVGLGNVTNESKATMFTSPAFTGTPTAPTAAVTVNTTQIATTAYVKSQIVAAGSATVGVLAYNGNTAVAGQLDGSATAPTGTTRLNYGGYLYATRVYNAVFNDYAEYFLRGEEGLEAGDILMLDIDSDIEEYIKTDSEYSSFVVGVISDDYGQCMGGEGKEDDILKFAPIGLAGRVRVKVTGDINKGDLITSSPIPGVGMVAMEYFPGTIIGKALESHTGDSIDRIKMLIMNV